MTRLNNTLGSEGIAPIELSYDCPKDWDGMAGDEAKRFCDLCQKHVHNLSAMTETAANAFIDDVNKHNRNVCITYELTEQGVIKTQAETSGVIWLSRFLGHTASAPLPWVAAFLVLTLALSPTSWANDTPKPAPCKVDNTRATESRVVGEMLYTPPENSPSKTTPSSTQNDPKPTRTLGKIAPQPKPKPNPPIVRGRMAPVPPKK